MVLADSPVSFWRLGEAGGTTAADTAGGDPGTYAGGVTLGSSGALAGETDTAVTLDGTNDYVGVPDSSRLDVGDVFSLELWAKRARTNGEEYLVFKGGGQFAVYFAAGTNRLTFDNDDVVAARANAATTDTAWHHWVVTHDASGTRIYRDGVDVTSVGAAVTFTSSSAPLRLGAYGNLPSGSFFGGSLDEVALYSKVLSPAQVAAHYAAATTP